jgi:Na+/H+-dicarboxylate symporter
MKKTINLKKILTNLTFLIIFSMILGVVAGRIMGESARMFAPLGEIFIQLIKMLVVPLVFVSIVSGSTALGATKSAGKVGFWSLAFIFSTTLLAVIIAFVFGGIFKPGAGISFDMIRDFLPAEAYSAKTEESGFWEIIIGIIPDNPVRALTEGNILQIIFFGLFLGFGISVLSEEKKRPVINAFNTILNALIWCIEKVMWVAPVGVFGLMADATGTFGFDLLLKAGNLLWVNILAVFFVGLLVYPLLLKLFSKISIKKFFKAMIRPQVVAFSTASSMATLPVNLEVVENELGVNKAVASFVVPLGATINMAGNAIYYTLVALFFSQLYGIDLAISQYVAIALTATVGSVGQAGVPGPTLLVVAVLASAGIPIEGLPLLYALDRVFDMLRTVLNITGDAVCAVIVDRFNN